jgi:hypothetical protein
MMLTSHPTLHLTIHDAGLLEPAQRMERFKEFSMWLDKWVLLP